MSSRKAITKKVSDEVMNYWKNRCAFCGNSEIDRNHITLLSETGSSTDTGNFILLCKNHHSLYHRKTPSGQTYITKKDFIDVEGKRNVDKKFFSLAIESNKRYTFGFGQAKLQDIEKLLMFENRVIFELYHVPPVSTATEQRSFLSLRLYDKDGSWFCSVFRNVLCCISNHEIEAISNSSADFVTIKVNRKDKDEYSEIKISIKGDYIKIIGRFWCLGKLIEITDSHIKIGDSINLQDITLKKGRGITIFNNGNIKLGDGIMVNPGGKVDMNNTIIEKIESGGSRIITNVFPPQ